MSYNQLISVRWLARDLLCYITTDGSVTIMRIAQVQGKCEMVKVGQIANAFEEVQNQFNFASQGVRQS